MLIPSQFLTDKPLDIPPPLKLQYTHSLTQPLPGEGVAASDHIFRHRQGRKQWTGVEGRGAESI